MPNVTKKKKASPTRVAKTRTAAAPRAKSAAKEPAAATKKAARGATKTSTTAKGSKYGPRIDLGTPIDSFFAKQPAELQPILEALRELVEQTIPAAQSSIKWGMPFYTLDGMMLCALGGHKSHVNLILAGPPEVFVDPKELLEGDGKTGRRLKLTKLADLPKTAVRTWLLAAAAHARTLH
ncbi:MAG: hypothetical protein RL701_5975 [Pseudomonadota bacterium]